MSREARMSDRLAFLQAILRTDLASFIERCFATLEPGTPYRNNWHMHAIAYQLMRVRNGEGKRLIINVPPRSCKSIAVTIGFTAWLMGHDPSKAGHGDLLRQRSCAQTRDRLSHDRREPLV